jgi:hypothetical protein
VIRRAVGIVSWDGWPQAGMHEPAGCTATGGLSGTRAWKHHVRGVTRGDRFACPGSRRLDWLRNARRRYINDAINAPMFCDLLYRGQYSDAKQTVKSQIAAISVIMHEFKRRDQRTIDAPDPMTRHSSFHRRQELPQVVRHGIRLLAAFFAGQ